MKVHNGLENFANTLVYLAEYYHKKTTVETILSGLPIGKNSNELLLRAGEKAGFSLKLVAYKLTEFIEPLLPVILLLEEGSFILFEIDKEKERYHLLDAQGKVVWLSTEALDKVYTKKAYLVKSLPNSQIQKEYFSTRKHWFWDSLKFSRSLYVDVFVATFLLNVFALLTPLFVRNVYDRVIPNAAFDTLFMLASGIILVYVFDIVFRFLRTYLLEVAGKKSDIIVSSKLFEHILNLKLSHKFKSVGAFANNIKEFDTLRNFLSSASLTMLVDLPFTLLFLFIIYVLAGNIMFVPLIAGVLIIVYGLIIAKPLKKHIDETSKLASWKSGVLIESLSALETIKSFGLNSIMQWKWEESVGEIANTNMKSKILTTSMSTLSNFVVQVSNVLVIILGVYAIHEKTLTMGGLIAVTMLTSRALSPLVQISSLIVNYEYAKSSYEILNAIYNMPVENDKDKTYITRENLEGKIEFRNVTFAYPETEHLILDNVCFVVQAGESVALLGANGSGKSTLLKLIMGFYEPTSGTILIDGIDMKQINPADLRKQLNYIPQDVVLFNGTIQENIQYSLPKASTEDMIESAKMSGLDTFIDTNPLGYNFPVEERGAGVSGGQKQLIGMARFFLRKESKLLLLDEPTNALDAQTEAIMLQNLHDFTQNKTTFLVSHKRNLLQLAERAIVLNNGTMVYDGPKDEVLKQLEGKAK